MKAAGTVSGTVIQALRHLGKANVTGEMIGRLQTSLSLEDKQIVQRDLLLAPGWMRPVLAQIVQTQTASDTGVAEG